MNRIDHRCALTIVTILELSGHRRFMQESVFEPQPRHLDLKEITEELVDDRVTAFS